MKDADGYTSVVSATSTAQRAAILPAELGSHNVFVPHDFKKKFA